MSLTTSTTDIRQEALKWYRAMEYDERKRVVDRWRKITNSSKKGWNAVMIAHSSSTIERIYRELEMQENFDN